MKVHNILQTNLIEGGISARPFTVNVHSSIHDNFSAGVGRTGTYIALDHLMQFINEHDFDVTIDIFDLVLKLRENRQHMVQTEVDELDSLLNVICNYSLYLIITLMKRLMFTICKIIVILRE